MVQIRWKRLLWKSFTITEESRSSAPPRLPHPRTTMLPRGRVGCPSLKWNLCSQFELRRSPRSESRLFSRSSLFCRWTHSSPATLCKTLLVWSWRELQFLKLWILDWSKMNTMYSLIGRLTWACCVTNLSHTYVMWQVTRNRKRVRWQIVSCLNICKGDKEEPVDSGQDTKAVAVTPVFSFQPSLPSFLSLLRSSSASCFPPFVIKISSFWSSSCI